MPILRDATDSDAVNSLSVHAERFFWRLLQKCDDYGRFHADPVRLTSALFPLKRDVRDTDQARSLAECERAGLVRCYVDRQGRKLLQVLKWKDNKKHKKSTFDPPDFEGQMPLALETKKILRRPLEVEAEVEGEVEGAAPVQKVNGKCKAVRADWQLLKDEAALMERLRYEKYRTKPDKALIESLRARLAKTRDEIRSHS